MTENRRPGDGMRYHTSINSRCGSRGVTSGPGFPEEHIDLAANRATTSGQQRSQVAAALWVSRALEWIVRRTTQLAEMFVQPLSYALAWNPESDYPESLEAARLRGALRSLLGLGLQ